MAAFTVRVDDNFHFMDESERHTAGIFDSYDMAVKACRAIVDMELKKGQETCTSAEHLFEGCCAGGLDPWIAEDNPDGINFSAWDYAKRRSLELLGED